MTSISSQKHFEDDHLDVVKLSGLVLLKILKHARETHPPHKATGQLLGLDVVTQTAGASRVLELTNCFPNISKEPTEDDRGLDKDEEFELKETQHQQAMLRQLKEINVDANVVGWYLVTWHQQFTQNHVLNQLDYQLNLWPKCVCIIFDPLLSQEREQLCVRAVRLKRSYVAAWKQLQQGAEGRTRGQLQHIIGEDQTSQILEEIPVELFNTTVLSDVFTLQYVSSRAHVPPPLFSPYERSVLTSTARSVGAVTEGADEIAHQMNQYQQILRKYQQSLQYYVGQPGKMQQQPPPRMPLLYSVRQTSALCKDLDEASKRSLRHLYVTHELHEAQMGSGD